MSPDKRRFTSKLSAVSELQKARNITPIELAKIFKLDSGAVVTGLVELLWQRIDPLIITNSRTPEQEWQFNAYGVVSSLFKSPPDTADIYFGGSSYKPTIERILKYMKFLGFSDAELSSDSILAASESLKKSYDYERREREEGVIVLDLRRPIAPYQPKTRREEFLEKKVQELGKSLDIALGFDIEAEDKATLDLLDSLMLAFDKFPTLEKYKSHLKRINKLFEYLNNPSK